MGTAPPAADVADFTALLAPLTTLEAPLATLDAPLTATLKIVVAPLITSVVRVDSVLFTPEPELEPVVVVAVLFSR